MSKKKKHRKNRKTRAQKLARQQASQTTLPASSVLKDSSHSLDTNIEADKVKSSSDRNEYLQEDNAVQYVKADIARSLSLVGLILLVFVIIYFILAKTSYGNTLYSLIKL